MPAKPPRSTGCHVCGQGSHRGPLVQYPLLAEVFKWGHEWAHPRCVRGRNLNRKAEQILTQRVIREDKSRRTHKRAVTSLPQRAPIPPRERREPRYRHKKPRHWIELPDGGRWTCTSDGPKWNQWHYIKEPV